LTLITWECLPIVLPDDYFTAQGPRM